MAIKKELKFPKGFLWGSAVSAHQVEGNNVNSDWWEWEQKGGGKEHSGTACNFYNRYEEDIKIVRDLNQNAFRLSLEWARIEPGMGEFSKKEMEHYREILKSLKDKGITTFVTIHHFTNPIWFANLGGWENCKSSKYFSRYVKYCTHHFEDLVDLWITVNEPTVYAGQSYLLGLWPPQKKNFLRACRVFLNMIEAYNKTSLSLKKPHGIAHNIPRFTGSKNPLDLLLAKSLNFIFLDIPILLCLKKQDFIGVNYYSQFKIKNGKFSFDYLLGRTDMEWPIAPEGLYKILLNLKKYKKPIYITENGCADSQDKIRKFYIKEHLKAAHMAIENGVDVRGYFYWSLIDNFEWHWGFKPRFGLVEIDRRNNLKRKIRKSAKCYSKVCEENLMKP